MKKIVVVIASMCLALTLVGCRASQSLSFNVATGECVKIEANLKEKYMVKKTGEDELGYFKIVREDEKLCAGGFDGAEKYEDYRNYFLQSEGEDQYVEGGTTENGCDYFICYLSKDKSYVAMILPDDAKTIVKFESSDLDELKGCIENVSIELDD